MAWSIAAPVSPLDGPMPNAASCQCQRELGGDLRELPFRIAADNTILALNSFMMLPWFP